MTLPLLSISLAAQEPIGRFPRVLDAPPDAHHRYRVLRRNEIGSSVSDLTILWVRINTNPLYWLGLWDPSATLRKDGRILIVLAQTQGVSAARIDRLELEIRERLAEMGVAADDLPLVHDVRLSKRRNIAGEGSAVVEALNRFARPQRTGFEFPLIASCRLRSSDPARGYLAENPSDFSWLVHPYLGCLGDGDPIVFHRSGSFHPEITPANTSPTEALERHRVTVPITPSASVSGRVERFEDGTFSIAGVHRPPPNETSFITSPDLKLADTFDLRVIRIWQDGECDPEPYTRPGQEIEMHLPGFGWAQMVTIVDRSFDAAGPLLRVSQLAPAALLDGPIYLTLRTEHLLIETELVAARCSGEGE